MKNIVRKNVHKSVELQTIYETELIFYSQFSRRVILYVFTVFTRARTNKFVSFIVCSAKRALHLLSSLFKRFSSNILISDRTLLRPHLHETFVLFPIPGTFAGNISAAVPFSFLRWRIVLAWNGQEFSGTGPVGFYSYFLEPLWLTFVAHGIQVLYYEAYSLVFISVIKTGNCIGPN